MANNLLQAYHVEHPAPDAGAVGLPLLFAGLLLPPLAWTIELFVDYGLASHACFPRAQPLLSTPPGWGTVWSTLLAVNIAALLVACVATFISFCIWRRTRGAVSSRQEELVEAGEGRTRFLAVWGIWTGVWFAIAILFNTIAVFAVPTCGS
jgi:hypothetical protein